MMKNMVQNASFVRNQSQQVSREYSNHGEMLNFDFLLGLRHVDIDGKLIHEDCFQCCNKTCRKKLDDGYIPKDDEFFCQECYQDSISVVC